MAIRFDLHVLDHNGIPGFYKTANPINLVELKDVIEQDQRLANPTHDGWLCNYL